MNKPMKRIILHRKYKVDGKAVKGFKAYEMYYSYVNEYNITNIVGGVLFIVNQ